MVKISKKRSQKPLAVMVFEPAVLALLKHGRSVEESQGRGWCAGRYSNQCSTLGSAYALIVLSTLPNGAKVGMCAWHCTFSRNLKHKYFKR